MTHSRIGITLQVAVVAGLLTRNPQGWATDITWTNTAGGDFETAGNWSPNQVPSTTNDTAFFNESATYTVRWNQAVSNRTFSVLDGTVTFDLQGNTYWYHGGSPVDIGIQNQASNTTPTLIVTNGYVYRITNAIEFFALTRGTPPQGSTMRIYDADVTVNYLTVGKARNCKATMIVDGPNAKCSVYGYTTIGWGYPGTADGTLIVTNGGYVSLNNTRLGYSYISQGRLYVYSGSTADVLELTLGKSADCHGTVLVSGSNAMLNVLQKCGIGGAWNAEGGTSTVQVVDGGTLNVKNEHATIWPNSTVTLDGGSFLVPTNRNIYCRNGLVQGSGSLQGNFQNIGGTVRPGGSNQVGTLTITSGSYHNGDPFSSTNGTLEIELMADSFRR